MVVAPHHHSMKQLRVSNHCTCIYMCEINWWLNYLPKETYKSRNCNIFFVCRMIKKKRHKYSLLEANKYPLQVTWFLINKYWLPSRLNRVCHGLFMGDIRPLHKLKSTQLVCKAGYFNFLKFCMLTIDFNIPVF